MHIYTYVYMHIYYTLYIQYIYILYMMYNIYISRVALKIKHLHNYTIYLYSVLIFSQLTVSNFSQSFCEVSHKLKGTMPLHRISYRL